MSRNFALLFISNIFNSFAFYLLVPTLPLYFLSDLKLSFQEIGYAISSFSISVILFRPFAGYLVDRFRRTTLLRLTLVAIALTYLLYPRIHTFLGIVAIRIFHGMLFGISSSVLSAVAADLGGDRIGQAIALYSLTIPLGMMGGSFLGLTILKSSGAEIMFLFTFLVSLIPLTLSFFLSSPSEDSKKGRFFSLAHLISLDALPFSVSMIFPMMVYGSINTFAAIHAEQVGFGSCEIFFFLFCLSLILSRLFMGKLFDSGMIKTLVLGGLFLILLGTLTLSFSHGIFSFSISGILSGAGFGILMPTCQAAINAISRPNERGSANSTYFLSYDLGIGLSSFIVGHLLDTATVAEVYRIFSFIIPFAAIPFFLFALPRFHMKKGIAKLQTI
ncbi:MAG: MFS transporter [Desulfobacterota bacterium]|nr:MFS transporter [Thermodesulfobacteriota bacterium]MDW8001248.1 MFS transporter [Deltaproteobacteria bacterium]